MILGYLISLISLEVAFKIKHALVMYSSMHHWFAWW